MNWAVRLVLVSMLAAAAGCAAGPPPELMVPKAGDANYGYAERQVSERGYEITYYGPEIYTELTRKAWLDEIAGTAKTTSHDLALWRAAQLAASKGYKAFTVTGGTEAVRHYIVGRDYENVPVHQFEGAPVRKLEYWSGTYFRGQATLIVELTDEKTDGAFDAAETAAAMEGRYKTAVGAAIMADTRYYFGPASWLYDYDKNNYTEQPVFESSKEGRKPPERKPLGQPYYAP